jgi:uncharacterized protein
MNTDNKNIRLSASDLRGHLACRHLTNLDLAAARGEREALRWHSPDAAVLRQRGMEHEQAYLAHLKRTLGGPTNNQRAGL